MPNITDKKIKELNDPDFEGPPTQAETEAALMESTSVSTNVIMHRFHGQLDVFQPHTQCGITNKVPLD